MINLYKILKIKPFVSSREIKMALENYENFHEKPDAKIIQATKEWLLVESVRARYDAQLKSQFPDFFEESEEEILKRHLTNQLTKKTQPTQPIQQPKPINSKSESKSESSEYYVAESVEVETEIEEDLDEILEESEEIEEIEAKYDYVPYLFSSKPLIAWSFIFTPLFGAYLQAMNWRELGQHDLAKQNMNIVWGLVVFSFVYILLLIFFAIDIPLWAWIAMWAIWFFAWGKKQFDYINQHIGDDYDPREWTRTLGISVGLVMGYFVIGGILLMLALITGIAHESYYTINPLNP